MNRGEIVEAAFDIQTSMIHLWKQCFTAILKEEGVTHAQMALLMLMHAKQPIMSKDIAEHLLQTRSATTQLVDSLSNPGLVLREIDPADRRIVRLRLSAEGEQLVGRLKAKRKELFYASTESFSDSELQTHLEFQQKSLDRLRAYIDKQS